MKYLVYNVAADGGGALSVLQMYYEKYSNDAENEYVFLISTPELKTTENITVINKKWVKKSWLHRLFFEYICVKKIIREHGIDEVISLQNILLPNVNQTQTLLVQNAMPFTTVKFSILHDTKLWIYKHLISKKIIKSIHQADEVIVQTEWMADEIKKIKKNNHTVKVEKPYYEIKIPESSAKEIINGCVFFYPASGESYKNHQVIVEAARGLVAQGSQFKVIFTLKGNENSFVERLFNEAQKYRLPIQFADKMSREQVFGYYSKTILIFPSLLETVGLPLMEAREVGTSIIAADLPYAREVLTGYETKTFFVDPFDSEDLQKTMNQLILNKKSG
ncbi:glycosyltransferase [Vagococcus elongatus]|uniref:Glycosyl transferase family 1 domain-containing protein n=1 Tax=Vagococcus elongatus TaxID=180344 RepID=A0A430B3Z5_9ENTE|nr:glycosyltransferase [Vagococcus elongatus]RSU15076.1 hypothetical protein CBF29_01695 [Vagococcus elongatus]